MSHTVEDACVLSPSWGCIVPSLLEKRVKTSTLWRTQAFQPTNSIHIMKYLEFQAGLLLFPHFCPIPSVVLGLVQEILWHIFLCDCSKFPPFYSSAIEEPFEQMVIPSYRLYSPQPCLPVLSPTSRCKTPWL